MAQVPVDGATQRHGLIAAPPRVQAVTLTAIDLAIATGTSAGKTQLGTVDVAGDTMTMTLAEPGAAARTDSSDAANKLLLARVKPIAKEFEGEWEGAIDAGGQRLRLLIKLTNGADGLAPRSRTAGADTARLKAATIRHLHTCPVWSAVGSGDRRIQRRHAYGDQ